MYKLRKPGKVGLKPTIPLGFNTDGSEPAPQGPYYTGAGFNVAIGRPVADEHYKRLREREKDFHLSPSLEVYEVFLLIAFLISVYI